MISLIKKFYHTFLIPEDNKKYYGEYKGSFNKFRSFVWNLVHIKRLIIRLKYKLTFFFDNSRKNFLSEEFKKNNFTPELNQDSKNILLKKMEELNNNGGVVIENYFSDEKIDSFLLKHKSHVEKICVLESNKHNDEKNEPLSLSNELVNLWLDDRLLIFIKSFFKGQVYARNYPHIAATKIDHSFDSKEKHEHKLNKQKTSDDWHVDHSTLFNLHVLLNDITAEDPHMEYLEKTHKYFNSTHPYSNEEVKSKNFNIKKCIGKKGTIYMHYGNVLHRLNLTPSPKTRTVLHLEFTPGPNILLDINNIVQSLKSGYNLEKLELYKREILKGIYPLKLIKGYEVRKNALLPNKYLGI